jgi:hypothetical protein
MSFGGLFNMLQLWYIEGDGDSEERGITAYGLGHAITDLEQVRPGDFLSYSSAPASGHPVIFIDWIAFLNSRRQPALTSRLFSRQSRLKPRAPDLTR